jgi:hypothetical protein
VYSIKHVKVALLFNRDGQPFIQHIKKNLGCLGIQGGHGKVINLTKENSMQSIDNTGVEAWFMCSWCQTDFSKNGVSMFFPTEEEILGGLAWQTK